MERRDLLRNGFEGKNSKTCECREMNIASARFSTLTGPLERKGTEKRIVGNHRRHLLSEGQQQRDVAKLNFWIDPRAPHTPFCRSRTVRTDPQLLRISVVKRQLNKTGTNKRRYDEQQAAS